jgi:type I restriction enzyme S subunit
MVEWKKIGDVCEVITGGEVPDDTIKGQTIATKEHPYAVYTNGKEIYGFSKTYQVECDAVCISSIGANTGAVFYKLGKFTPAIRLKVLIPHIELKTKYLYYAACLIDFKGKNTGSVPNINADYVKNKVIPLVSLSEQERIVSILDTFTSSIDNLKQQITQRRKQYEYYRDQLLDLEGNEGVEMKTLGEIGVCVAGATPSTKIADYWEGGNIPWMSSGEVHQKVVTHTSSLITQKGYDNASTKMLPVNTIVIALAGQGKTRGSVAITAIELCTNQSLCGVIIDNAQINNKYVYYYMTTRYNDLRRISSGEGTRGGLNLKMIASYPIPVTSLSEQQRIVDILDQFETSIQNLEAQLSQREKQYEYYRNKLLTFE